MATVYDLTPDSLFTVPKSDRTTTCKICHLPSVPYEDMPEINLGELYQFGKSIVDEDGKKDIEVYCAHYFCLLFSPGLKTNGDDHEGIRGFLPEDILKEWRRGSRLKCVYCEKKYATMGCCKGKTCRKIYHLPCGLRNGIHVQFCGSYDTFCKDHRPRQDIYSKLSPEVLQEPRECGVCLENLKPITDQSDDEKRFTLYSPCCGGWFHKSCVQRAAEMAGYFFKCPLCNNNDKFAEEMKKFGVYVPEQDAAWELEGDQFDDHYARHDRCDADLCICPEGRHKDEDYTIWEIILCKFCGSQGIHVQCGNLEMKDDITWKCPGCVTVVKNLPPTVVHKFRPISVTHQNSSRKRLLTDTLKSTTIRLSDTGAITFNVRSKKFAVTLDKIDKFDVPMPVKLHSGFDQEKQGPSTVNFSTKSHQQSNDSLILTGNESNEMCQESSAVLSSPIPETCQTILVSDDDDDDDDKRRSENFQTEKPDPSSLKKKIKIPASLKVEVKNLKVLSQVENKSDVVPSRKRKNEGWQSQNVRSENVSPVSGSKMPRLDPSQKSILHYFQRFFS